MVQMPDIAQQAWAATHHNQETPVTTQTRPNIFGDAAVTLGRLSATLLAIGGNDLIARLASDDLGRGLAADDIEHVLALVRSFEASHAMPQRTPASTTPQPVA